jgi:transposase
MKRPRIDVDLGELDGMLDRATTAPMSEADAGKIKTTLHALVEILAANRTSEKTRRVLPKTDEAAQSQTAQSSEGNGKAAGHGRRPASEYTGAKKVTVGHPELKHGDPCPLCPTGKVYVQKKPRVLVRIVGQAPLAATAYELEQLRCNGCQQVFTAPEPEGVGTEKFDETASAMIAQLKYGSGMPFARLAALEKVLGVPLPASTQWEAVEEAAELIKPVHEDLIRQAAQGEVLHNDDTSMRILNLKREEADKRTGVFTSGIVSVGQYQIALFFTGRQHAGENLSDVLGQRAPGAPPPIQMSDALSRNAPKGSAIEVLVANCLAHGRRQFVDVANQFPVECRYVLETLGQVYVHDDQARERGLTPQQRLEWHQQHSGPLMEELKNWGDRQLSEKRTEPNSGLGKAIQYLRNHWTKLTLFLRQAGAPLDNNICERALKFVVLHRKNALFYKTLHGADVGDLFMSLIHTCRLNSVNSFDYLTELLRHAGEVAKDPGQWMPWNYRAALEAAK